MTTKRILTKRGRALKQALSLFCCLFITLVIAYGLATGLTTDDEFAKSRLNEHLQSVNEQRAASESSERIRFDIRH